MWSGTRRWAPLSFTHRALLIVTATAIAAAIPVGAVGQSPEDEAMAASTAPVGFTTELAVGIADQTADPGVVAAACLGIVLCCALALVVRAVTLRRRPLDAPRLGAGMEVADDVICSLSSERLAPSLQALSISRT